MCTVSFIPKGGTKFILTSNRDERILRETHPPKSIKTDSGSVVFPRDQKAGGTWIASGDIGRTCCLLNGAFENHIPKANYSKSRGKVLLEAFEFENISDFFRLSDLTNVAPFTLLIVDCNESPRLVEYRWDEMNKHVKELDMNKPHFWSSVTLYSADKRQEKLQKFTHWLQGKTEINSEDIVNFHLDIQGPEMDLNIEYNRIDKLQTVSITQVEARQENFSMHYHDLAKNTRSTLTKPLKSRVYE